MLGTSSRCHPPCRVPTELPGAPTNLGISNIGPRSVTIQFRPGYDGKTSISRWQVEAQVQSGSGRGGRGCLGSAHPTHPNATPQVGQNGEAGQWGLVHQLANEPDTRSMEVPNLRPYTYYRRVPGRCHPWGNGALMCPLLIVTPGDWSSLVAPHDSPSPVPVSACGR